MYAMITYDEGVSLNFIHTHLNFKKKKSIIKDTSY